MGWAVCSRQLQSDLLTVLKHPVADKVLFCCCDPPPWHVQYVGPELDDPSSNECMQFMQRVGRENWKAFANKKVQVRHRNITCSRTALTADSIQA